MTTQTLENCIDEEHLKKSGFYKKKGKDYYFRTIHEQEIRFYHVQDNLYALDSKVYYVGRSVELYEENL